MRVVTALTTALLVLALAEPSRAADCSKLQILGNLQMTRDQDGDDLIPVKLDGKDAQLQF
jgi:hypothetical protein